MNTPLLVPSVGVAADGFLCLVIRSAESGAEVSRLALPRDIAAEMILDLEAGLKLEERRLRAAAPAPKVDLLALNDRIQRHQGR